MATEHPRRHVWTGDDYSTLTFLVKVGDPSGGFNSRYLVNAFGPGFAITTVLQYIGDRLEGFTQFTVEIRPLTEDEVKKNNLTKDEIVVLDELSFIHLINGEKS